MTNLSDDELRIEIAKLRGWKFAETRKNSKLVIPFRDGAGFGWTILDNPNYEQVAWFNVPDYTRDISAAYDLEGSVPADKHQDYTNNLHKVLLGDDKERGGLGVTEWDFAHSTARQKCEAYRLTMEVKYVQ